MELPRYVVAKARKNSTAYYWQVPAKLRLKTSIGVWPEGSRRLPDDETEMRVAAARLNTELDLGRAPANQDPVYGHGTLPWLIREYEHSDYYKPLKPRTQRHYTTLSRYVVRWSKSRNNPQVTGLTTPKILEFLSTFGSRVSLRNQIGKYIAVVLEYGRRIGLLQINHARRLGLKRAKRSKPIRILTIEQVLTLAAKAREMDLPHIAIGVLLHFDLGQRQGDILRLQKPRDYRDGVFRFAQSKTDQEVTIRPFLKETREALDALPANRFNLVSTKYGLAVKEATYRADFRKVANACGFNDVWEMELRHSCVIYMEQAGLTPGEISTRTGHRLASVFTILEHYRYRDDRVAMQGAIKLEAYRNKNASGT